MRKIDWAGVCLLGLFAGCTLIWGIAYSSAVQPTVFGKDICACECGQFAGRP